MDDDQNDDGDDLLHKSLTITAGIFYLILFFYIYAQLISVLYYGHKRWCFRTAVLFVSVTWAGLRVTLFSYYWWMKEKSDPQNFPELSRNVGREVYFLLFSFPLYLQFTVLCLLVAYFSHILAISEDRYASISQRICTTERTTTFVVISNMIVFSSNLICAIYIKAEENIIPNDENSKDFFVHFPHLVAYIIYARVFVNGFMFIVLSFLLAYLIIQVSKTEEVRLLLETENITQGGATSVGVLLVGLCLCRAIANVLALIPSIRWIYDTDQIDLLSDSSAGYYMFLAVLFLWEYLPTFASVFFFRVKKPKPIVAVPSYTAYAHPIGDDDDTILVESFDSCSLTNPAVETLPRHLYSPTRYPGNYISPTTPNGSAAFRALHRSMGPQEQFYA